MTPTWRHKFSRWIARHELGRFGELIFEDPTRNLQFWLGFYVVLLGWNALSVLPITPSETNQVIYWWADRQVWGCVRLVVGAAQMATALTRPEAWRWRFATAQAQVAMAAYIFTASWLTTGEAAFAVGQLWLLIVQSWIAGRTLFDRDLNGTDRRSRFPGDSPYGRS